MVRFDMLPKQVDTNTRDSPSNTICSKVLRFILLDKKGALVQLTFISSNSYCCTYESNWQFLCIYRKKRKTIFL
jgi:hypothetical protein